MADAVYSPGLVAGSPDVLIPARHSAVVRITHWISTISFIGLVVSGIAIILAHPRFYWGETGGLGTPSIIDLPLPFMLGGPSGWGRYLHFESAWLCVLNGLFYVCSSLANRHFRKALVPAKQTLTWKSVKAAVMGRGGSERSYNVVQRVTYLAVIFFLFPLMIWTGLAMSPAVTSVFPWLVTLLGGHQCARTIHFFGMIALLLFVFMHIALVWRAGFRKRVGAMTTGHIETL